MRIVSCEEVVSNIRFFMNGKWKGFKQVAIAERAGFNEKEFSNMLNGRKRLQALDIVKIAAALEVTPNDLLLCREPSISKSKNSESLIS